MTIITQPLTEKKLAKSPQAKPLVQHESGNEGDVEGSPSHSDDARTSREHNHDTFTNYKVRHFRGWCGVPYVSDSKMPPVMGSDFLRQSSNGGYGSSPEVANSIVDPVRDNNIFQERFDLDLEYELYEEIEVPDFSHGRRGRFIHDFAANKTGIVDVEGRRCFVMPLNRSLVLPPTLAVRPDCQDAGWLL
ncbi:hypothetical protein MRX96_017103 [Rhipicephalus microplus]